MCDSDCSEEYDDDAFYQQNGQAYFKLDKELKQQRILAETATEDQGKLLLEAGRKEDGQDEAAAAEGQAMDNKADDGDVGDDYMINPEQEGSLDDMAANDAAIKGDNNTMAANEAVDYETRRQETVGFSTEADEISFNEYREKVTEKAKTQYLRTSIDSEVRHCQKMSQLQTKQTDGYDFYFNYELNTKTWHQFVNKQIM